VARLLRCEPAELEEAGRAVAVVVSPGNGATLVALEGDAWPAPDDIPPCQMPCPRIETSCRHCHPV
jgi:hypothetical protein